ncbi:sulfotransferase family protein [Candidatus Leptofilum sp.]|uniref:sulfotransferase family protein n=1 Tax=Candidatus Leptofilum sp. TaxID=3241576 RepID=UPI003B5A3E74
MIAQVDKAYIKERPGSALRRIITRLLFEGRPVTTNRRWLNTIVFAHFALEKRLDIWKSVKKPIFIMGTGRSGTTILATLLSFHPQVGLLNEPKAMWHSIYNQEDVNGNYTTTLPAKYHLGASDVNGRTIQTAHRLFGAYSTLTFARRVVDKNPEIVFRVSFVQAIFPDAKFIFLVRDGWDTIRSIASWSEREVVQVNGETHDWWGVDRRKWHIMVKELVMGNLLFAGRESSVQKLERQIDMAAVEWIVTMQAGIAQYQQHPANIYLLNYQDLVQTPQQTLADLLTFCELPQDSQLLQYAQERLSEPTQYKPVALDKSIADLFQRQIESVEKLMQAVS